MRIALLSDIHGNDFALEAVLSDVADKGSVDAYWILGDLVAIGPSPIRVLEILADLPNSTFVSGNTERYVCKGDRPHPTNEEVLMDGSLLAQRIEIEGDFCWTQGAVTVTGWLEWLSNLPLEIRTWLPDGTSVLCVHASPGQDDGTGIYPGIKQDHLQDLLVDCPEDLIIVGHTHRSFQVQFEKKRIINPGSVSNPFQTEVFASYAILHADKKGYEVFFHRVKYDHKRVIDKLIYINHPARRFIAKHFCVEI
jgi:predicted phosphodiesterase